MIQNCIIEHIYQEDEGLSSYTICARQLLVRIFNSNIDLSHFENRLRHIILKFVTLAIRFVTWTVAECNRVSKNVQIKARRIVAK